MEKEEKLNNFEDLNSDLDMSITNLVQELSQLDNQPKTKTKKPTPTPANTAKTAQAVKKGIDLRAVPKYSLIFGLLKPRVERPPENLSRDSRIF